MKAVLGRERHSRRLALGVSIVAVAALALAGCASGGSSSSGSSSKLTIGEIFPFTGSKSILSDWGVHGVAAGIYELHHNGGVMGHQLVAASADDAADSVDTLPA